MRGHRRQDGLRRFKPEWRGAALGRKKSGPWAAPMHRIIRGQALRISDACFPLGESRTSKMTLSPSLSDLKPSWTICVKWAKRSAEPSSGVMKPKPFASLNHFTVPVAMMLPCVEVGVGLRHCRACREWDALGEDIMAVSKKSRRKGKNNWSRMVLFWGRGGR